MTVAWPSIQRMLAWWQDRERALQEPTGPLERVTYHIAPRWIAAVRREADLTGETLASVLAEYEEIARHTDELVATIDLDSSHPLPPAPWFEKGASRTARRVFLHVIAETAQHAGHADILRESIDGQKTMG